MRRLDHIASRWKVPCCLLLVEKHSVSALHPTSRYEMALVMQLVLKNMADEFAADEAQEEASETDAVLGMQLTESELMLSLQLADAISVLSDEE